MKNKWMRQLFGSLLIMSVTCVFHACGSSSSDSTPQTPSLMTLQGLPELDLSKYDTTSSYYSAPSTSISSKKKGILKSAVNTGTFSRSGCEMKSIKNTALNVGTFAEGFLCVYQIAEQYYSDTLFTIPTNSFNYYEIIDQMGSTIWGRIGYYPGGYGNNSEAVLVIDECEVAAGENPSSQTAAMRVNSSSTSQDFQGAGYYVSLIELPPSGENEQVHLIADTRSAEWRFVVQYAQEDLGYGSITLDYDPAGEYNTIGASSHEVSGDGEYDILLNSAFGPYTEIAGFTTGGTVTLDMSDSDLIDGTFGFLFQNSATLPAISLESGTGDNTDLPYYSELAAMGDLPTLSQPDFEFTESWNCTGGTFVEIDLSPADIAAALLECEAAGDVVMTIEDTCENLEQ